MDEAEDFNDVVIKLYGTDDQFNCFDIGFEVGKHIGYVKDCLEDTLCKGSDDDESGDDDDDDDGEVKNKNCHELHLRKVKYKALEKVVKFCKRCAAHPMELAHLNDIRLPIPSFHLKELIPEWHADFVSKMSVAEVFELFSASHFLWIEPLFKLLSLPVSILITVYDSTGTKVLLDWLLFYF